MKASQKNASLALLAGLAALVAVAPAIAPVFAWNACGVTLTPSTQSTSIPAGTTATLTYLLTYSDSSAYAASFGVSATSSNTAWTVVSVIPSQVPSSGKSDSISQTITVKITAPATTGSTTTLTVKAVNQQDGSADCSTGTRLTTVAFQPPPTVPQFPLGFALLMAVAIPVMFVAKSKYAARATR